MDENRLRGLMGLCVRARQAVFGEDGCLKAVRQGSCGVLLLDSGASRATRDKYHSACAHAGVALGELPEGLLWEATGRPGVAMAVSPGGLAEQIKRILPANEPGQPMKSANKCGGASVE
ncbi:MAG: L7Ae/L30e/S12e/Gadd45 family ribosomal protein [Aristaeellaceae bacterium]